MCDSPVLHTKNELKTRETNDYSPCFQLPGRRITGWCADGRSSRLVPKGGNVFPERSEYLLGTAGDCDVPNRLDLDGEVPAFALRMRELLGESPNVQLNDDPWGHVEHCDANCACLESDRTEAYIHNLLPTPETFHLTSPNDGEMSGEIENGFMFNNDCGYLGVGRPGLYRLYHRNRGHMAGCY